MKPQQEIKSKEYANEYELHRAVVQWLTLQYPHILFRSDYGGVRLPIGLAKKMKALNPLRAYPDLFIIEKNRHYNGLFIEIKLSETKFFKKNGEYSTPHIKEQAEYLLELGKRGFKAVFGLGFESIKHTITTYFNYSK